MILRFAENDLKWDLLGGGELLIFPSPIKMLGRGQTSYFQKIQVENKKFLVIFSFNREKKDFLVSLGLSPSPCIPTPLSNLNRLKK